MGIWRAWILLCFVLVGCGTELPSSTSIILTPRDAAQSAVLNLNIMAREASLTALSPDDDALLSADVGDREAVNYQANLGDQTLIALSANPAQSNTAPWAIQMHPAIPTSHVIDVTDGTFDADLSTLIVSRFDIVSENSSLNLSMPASPFQIVLDAGGSDVGVTIPANSQVQSAHFTTINSVLSLFVGDNTRMIGTVTITAGGATITVPPTTGVQLIVEDAHNSEITMPDRQREVAEAIIYTTPNFQTATAQVLLNSRLNDAAIRIMQE